MANPCALILNLIFCTKNTIVQALKTQIFPLRKNPCLFYYPQKTRFIEILVLKEHIQAILFKTS